MWERMKGLGWHKKFHWLIVYGVLCVIEFVVHKAKEHVELKFKPPKEEEDDDDHDDDDDDDDDEGPLRKSRQ